MKKKSLITKIICLFLFVGLYTADIQAQFIHFSQFYNQPLQLNPALTGSEMGVYRAAVTYRNQDGNVLVPYSTFSGSFDMSIGGCNGNAKDYFGVGVLIYHDVEGRGILKETSTALSFAYHRLLTKKWEVSLGGQLGYTHKKADFSELVFPSQILNFPINPILVTPGNTESDSFNYFNTKLGLSSIYSINESANLEFGASYDRAFEVDDTFLTPGGEANQFHGLWSLHFGGTFAINKNISFNPNALRMKKGVNELTIAGATFGYHFGGVGNQGNAVFLGSSYRFDDVVIFLAALDLGNLSLTGTYDHNAHDLDVAGDGKEAWEFSLIYRGLTKNCN